MCREVLTLRVPQCIKCVGQFCRDEECKQEQLPEFCPMKHKKKVVEKAIEKYFEKENNEIYINSTINEQQSYEIVRGRRIGVRPRLLELIQFSKMMGWKRLGVAYCGGVTREAKRIVEILEGADLKVYSVRCTCGNTDKTVVGVPKEYKISNLFGEPDKFEAGCNPIVQADVLNSESLNLHIIVGLCVGHDLAFTKYSKAPVTTLLVKDRVMGHNSMASLFSSYHHPRYWNEEI
jgi:uncharacterized metal-binding protein